MGPWFQVQTSSHDPRFSPCIPFRLGHPKLHALQHEPLQQLRVVIMSVDLHDVPDHDNRLTVLEITNHF
jgi:hypothetical protein